MKKKLKYVLYVALILFPHLSFAACYDHELRNAGYVIHPQDQFDKLDEALTKKMQNDETDSNGNLNYAFAGQGSIQQLGNPGIFQYLVIDDERTPKNEMYGDVVYLRDQPYPKGQDVEIRWYDNGIKNIVYKHKCALIGASSPKNSLLL